MRLYVYLVFVLQHLGDRSWQDSDTMQVNKYECANRCVPAPAARHQLHHTECIIPVSKDFFNKTQQTFWAVIDKLADQLVC